IYNPYTSTVAANGTLISRQPFPGNMIPASMLNPSAVIIAKAFYPLPNLAAGVVPGQNFAGESLSNNRPNQYSVRADHQFGRANNFFGRFSDSRDPNSTVNLPPAP